MKSRPARAWLRRWFLGSKLSVLVRPSGRTTVRHNGRVVYVGTLENFNRIVAERSE